MHQRHTIKEALARHPVLRLPTLQALGVTRSGLLRAVQAGDALNPCSGVYAHPDAPDTQAYELAVAVAATNGVVGGVTALHHHELTDLMPATIDLIVPREKARPPRGLPTVRLLRTIQPESFIVGIEVMRVLEMDVRITSPARTVVDVYRSNMGRDVEIEALHAYLAQDRTAASILALARHIPRSPVARIEADLTSHIHNQERSYR